MERILAIQIKRIGDLILTAPALTRLKRARPESRITLVTMGAAGQLVPAIPAVDEHFSYRYHRPNLAMWANVSTAGYDAVLDFNGLDRSVLMTCLSGAAIRATYAKRVRGWWREQVYTHASLAKLRRFHTVDHMAALLDVLDLPPARGEEPLSLAVPDVVQERIDARLGSLGLDGSFAVVHPGTARSEKYWLPERWAEVIDALASRPRPLPTVITGGNDPEEGRHLEAILASCCHRPAVLAGELSLLETAAVIRRASMALGVDTAAMHLAAAFRRPQVVLFGPTNPFHWRPRHADARIVFSGSGLLAEGGFDPRQPEAPMTGIETTEVLAAVETLTPGSGA